MFCFRDSSGAEDEEAMENLKLVRGFTARDLGQQFKKMLAQSPQSLPHLNASVLALLKDKCISNKALNVSPNRTKVYNSLVTGSAWDERSQQIKLWLLDFDSLTHKKFFNAIQKTLKIAGPRVMKTKFQCVSNAIKFPFSRDHSEFPPVTFTGESKSINELEISITGDSAMIIVVFHLSSILKQFLRSLDTVQPVTIFHDVPDKDKDKTAFAKKDEEVTLEDVTDNDDDAQKTVPEIPSDHLTNIAKRDIKSVYGDDETNSNKRFKKEEHSVVNILEEDVSVAKEALRVEDVDVGMFGFEELESREQEIEIEPCYICALLNIAANEDELLKANPITFQFKCYLECIATKDCLEVLVESIAELISNRTIDDTEIGNFITNIGSMLTGLLDKTPFSRPELYCKFLETLVNVQVNKWYRIISMLRELGEKLIGNDIDLFENTLKRNRVARRNMVLFIQNTGNYFSLQALLETLNMMHQKGIDLKTLLPKSMSCILDRFSSTPDSSSPEYFLFMADVTRNLIDLNNKNVSFFKAPKIEFHSGGAAYEKPGDLYIYLNKVDNVMYHFLRSEGSVICEEIQFDKLKYEEELKIISTDQWNFHLPDFIGFDLKSLVMPSTPHQNKSQTIPPTEPEAKKRTQQNRETQKTVIHNDNIGEDFEEVFSSEMGNISISEKRKNKKDQRVSDDDNIDNDDASENDFDFGGGQDQSIEKSLTIPKNELFKYWNPKNRTFIRNMCGEDWPDRYGCPCPVVFSYARPKKLNSRQRLNNFAKLRGRCKICHSRHDCIIERSPFDESISPEGKIICKPKSDMIIDIVVTGKFHLDDDDLPDIGAPKHDLKKAAGLFLKGREREILGAKVSEEGVQNVYMQQYDDVNEPQLKSGNTTSVKNYNVLKMARQEYERKQRCGDDFFQSVQNVYDSQSTDISQIFDSTKACRDLPGFVRSVQQTPFRIMMANFEQLRIGSTYLNKDDGATIFMDSSGKFLKKEKGKRKLLNTAVVIPPPAKGHSPFPIFEMVSESNKTVDFLTFLQYGWSYLSASINNETVRNPRIAVSDFSFANIHAILEIFNKVKIAEYLEVAYRSSMKNEEVPFATILTICENHFLPSLLQYARNLHQNKVIADTAVAGILKLFEAESIDEAIKIFQTLVHIHCSPDISTEARTNIKDSNYEDVSDYTNDFGDEATEEDDAKYGTRKGLRINSPYFKLFKKILDKAIDKNENRKVTNKFYAPKLLVGMTRQFLSLFPLFSASMLPDKNLKTNSYIELYWKDQRRILQNVPDRLRWPPRYLGELHAKIRREAKAIMSHAIIPNLKHGGKVKPGQDELFKKYVDEKQSVKATDKLKFIPTMPKKQKRKVEPNESFGGTSEMWDSQRLKDKQRKKDNYMKGRQIDHEAIVRRMDPPLESLKVTGSRMQLGDSSERSDLPESIVLNSDELGGLLNRSEFIGSQVVDSGLILLDKRLNEESNMKEKVFVYTIQILRLILYGVNNPIHGKNNLVNQGKFITILPRDFGLTVEDERMKAMSKGTNRDVAPGCHYTLVSNLQCGDGEVNVYETFEPFRSRTHLLTQDGKKVLKALTLQENLKVNCVNVQPQQENECGAISLGLAVQLCFYPENEVAIQSRLVDVRNELFRSLKQNQLDYFKYVKVKTGQMEKNLFSIDC